MILFSNCSLLVPGESSLREGHHVLIEDGRIREVSERAIAANGAEVIDLAGKTLMPGLIDCHVHVIATMLDFARNAKLPNAQIAYAILAPLKAMLARGFTTVRDAGGADAYIAKALEDGLIAGPRIFPSGKALSQTGGHGDLRARGERLCACGDLERLGLLSRIADGADAVRIAAREELQKGATQIKIMASGGVASPADRIESLQYSLDEIQTAVAEAQAQNTYVLAHAYTAPAIRRAIDCGVRTIEHGNLIDDETARRMHELGAYAVPTLITYDGLAEHGTRLGLPLESVAKIDRVRTAGLASLEIFRRAGVKMAYGSDLLGELQQLQGHEFVLRAQVLPAAEVIKSATVIGAEVLKMEGRLGVIAPDAIADLLVVDGDPLKNIALLDGQGEHLPIIMQAGRFYKRS